MTEELRSRALAGARPLRDSLYGDLIWSRLGILGRELRLEAGSELLARLRWEKFLSFEAQAESADGHWTIGRRRTSSLFGTLVVHDTATGAETAAFRRDWRARGVARFASGVEYRWEHEGFWRPTYFWSQGDDRRLITFKSEFGLTGRLEMGVDPAARTVVELPVLVLLGAYVMGMISSERRSH